MQLSEKIEQERLHHAYVVESSREEGMVALRELILGFGIPTEGNPDFHEYVFDAFLLDDANKLRREQSFFGADGAKKIFIVAFNTIGHEAQNALLKTLEEPTEGTHFFFVVRTREVFLPTILSRVQVIKNSVSSIQNQVSSENEGKKFLAASVSERMKIIEPIVKAKAEEKLKAKGKTRALLEFIERALYEKLPKAVFESSNPKTSLDNSKYISALEHVLFAERALSERSPSLKLILEHLALTVPKISF